MVTKRLYWLGAYCCVLLSGCVYHVGAPRGYQDVKVGQVTVLEKKLVVLPLLHSPVMGGDVTRSALVIIPLIPYVSTAIEQGQAAHYPAPYVADQVRKANLFSCVLFSQKARPTDGDLFLQPEITKSLIEESRTVYGLSIAGLLVQPILGLPSTKRNFVLEVRFRLLDQTNKVLWEKEYTERESCLAGVWGLPTSFWPYLTYGDQGSLMPQMGERITAGMIRDLDRFLSSAAVSD